MSKISFLFHNNCFFVTEFLRNAFAEVHFAFENLPVALHELDKVVQVLEFLIFTKHGEVAYWFRGLQHAVNFFFGNSVGLANHLDDFSFFFRNFRIAGGKVN